MEKIVIDPDEPISLEEMGLTVAEQAAKKYWVTHLPQLTAHLMAQGPIALELAIRKASHEQMYQEGLMQAQDPTRPLWDIQEQTHHLLYPPAESEETQDPSR